MENLKRPIMSNGIESVLEKLKGNLRAGCLTNPTKKESVFLKLFPKN
jgi:hypothetical protein